MSRRPTFLRPFLQPLDEKLQAGVQVGKGQRCQQKFQRPHEVQAGRQAQAPFGGVAHQPENSRQAEELHQAGSGVEGRCAFDRPAVCKQNADGISVIVKQVKKKPTLSVLD